MDSETLNQLVAPGGFLAVFTAAIGYVLQQARGVFKERNSEAVAEAEAAKAAKIAAEGKRDEARAALESERARVYVARQMLIDLGVKVQDLP